MYLLFRFRFSSITLRLQSRHAISAGSAPASRRRRAAAVLQGSWDLRFLPPAGGCHDRIAERRKWSGSSIRRDPTCSAEPDRTRFSIERQIVFGVGNPRADLMFIGEAPGADEDIQGEPFVGRAGQLLTNMIKAMGLRREDVYIANIIKCRPPGNRTPERDECETCSPFLFRQIEAIKPKVIVALGAVAAKTLLAMNSSMGELRGRWYDFRNTKLAVTYHPAFLLRDPRQKKETWKDLQMVMKELGLALPKQMVE
ncbi:MAG: DNA polymerase [Acidobacteria bacterium]|nr:MAG: DNA polymerase [Acidobacteriota bacterium]